MFVAAVFLVLPCILAIIVTPPFEFELVQGYDATIPCFLKTYGGADLKVYWARRPIGSNTYWEQIAKRSQESRFSVSATGGVRYGPLIHTKRVSGKLLLDV